MQGVRLPLNPTWFRRGRPLILHATVEPWRAEQAELELGDALYRLDPGLVIERPAPTVIHVYASLDPWRAFNEVVRYPPAYVSRLLPVEAHLEPGDPGRAVETVTALLQAKGVAEAELEVRVRGDCVDAEAVEEGLASRLRVRRKAAWLVRVEYVCPVGVAGVVEDRSDRVEYWRGRVTPQP